MMQQTTDNNNQYLLNQQVSFTQNFLSGMDAGEYQLSVSQQVLDSTGKPVSGDPYSNTYTFAVAGDRFSIARPADVVHSTFPMDNASGEYSNILPHVLFRNEMFPWIRFPNAQPPDQQSDVPTWLWLMTLDEDDVAAYPSLTAAITTRTIGDLFPPAVVTTSSLGTNYSYFQGATGITALEPGQNTANQINTIDVPLGLFWKLAPTIADLQQMAHGRTVSLINQPANSRTASGTPTGTFSIVFGNRLPQTNKKTFAFLVSLEQMQSFLPDAATGGPPSGNTYDGSKNIRFAVLSNWTFTSVGQPATFVHKLQTLNGCTPGGPPASNTNLRLDYSGTNPVVGAALSMGFVPLNETMRTSEQTVSWYRGPLVPYNVTEASLDLPIASPDAAMIFDPTTGMLDTSYSAAWTVGRMVALQDTAFSVSLYNWKRSIAQQVITSSESQLVEQTFGLALGQTQAAQKNVLLQSSVTSLFSRTVQAMASAINQDDEQLNG